MHIFLYLEGASIKRLKTTVLCVFLGEGENVEFRKRQNSSRNLMIFFLNSKDQT